MSQKGSVLILVLMLITISFLLFNNLILITVNEIKMMEYNYFRIKARYGAEAAILEVVNLIRNENEVNLKNIKNISGSLNQVDYKIKDILIKNKENKKIYKITAIGSIKEVRKEITVTITE